jgi:hypothetical protein
MGQCEIGLEVAHLAQNNEAVAIFYKNVEHG